MPKKNEQYTCPVCGNEMILRDGDINEIHFAHKSNECLDHWHYDMSEWHYNMQERFTEDEREIIVEHNGKKHRADILKGKQVIEFQYSSISMEEIEERNDFYNAAGYEIAWVFDVNEQYHDGYINDVEHDTALMYEWKNSKRSLKCFPKPIKNSKNRLVYLYWNEGEFEYFGKVIWSSHEDGYPNFKRFILSEFLMIEENPFSQLKVEEFFRSNKDRLNDLLKNIGCTYTIKYAGVKGHKRDDYTCSKTNAFGITQFGDSACNYCKHCAAIENYKNGFKSYCCYPKTPAITDTNLEYRSNGNICDVPEF